MKKMSSCTTLQGSSSAVPKALGDWTRSRWKIRRLWNVTGHVARKSPRCRLRGGRALSPAAQGRDFLIVVDSAVGDQDNGMIKRQQAPILWPVLPVWGVGVIREIGASGKTPLERLKSGQGIGKPFQSTSNLEDQASPEGQGLKVCKALRRIRRMSCWISERMDTTGSPYTSHPDTSLCQQQVRLVAGGIRARRPAAGALVRASGPGGTSLGPSRHDG